MRKTSVAAGVIAIALISTACGATKEAAPAARTEAAKQPASTAATSSETRVMTYLGKEYTVPVKAERIVMAGSMESMEDALVLGIKPVGANTVGGKFLEMFASITDKAEPIGEKTQPNLEAILKLKPDIILGSSKFPAEMMEKLGKVKTTLPISHISTDWEANLNALAELTGTQSKAKEAIEKYKKEATAAKEKLSTSLKDKKVLAIRVRTGNITIYPASVFFNPSLYTDLGLQVPEEVKQAKAQQTLSMEKLSEINPDYLFVQFAEDENKEQPKALEDLEKNPIWQSMNAVKNKKVFVNIVDPLTQGGTSYSKITFLEAALPKLSN
ncbi:ABC transporter substrate-binding protein [Paenibacillus lutrae]|uniref:ABC transporter substrate-binding protein n=1 Tax=Paenibacillus lutrae TaxID=2078573 RepID=A0A7X3FF69_9BACL|nr:ABC transporter substrate-binding protein [Paenibacillus lutrae]MVO98398.1 ABC transporter substrate-binding protein [Paenibacillus lutrae]